MTPQLAATTVHIDATILAMAIGTVIPVAVQLATKLRASASTRAMLQAMLAAVAGVAATAATHGGDINWQNALLNIGIAWTVAVATHFGLLVPTGTAVRLAALTAHLGIGPKHPPAATAATTPTTVDLPGSGPATVHAIGTTAAQVNMTPAITSVYITHPAQQTQPPDTIPPGATSEP